MIYRLFSFILDRFLFVDSDIFTGAIQVIWRSEKGHSWRVDEIWNSWNSLIFVPFLHTFLAVALILTNKTLLKLLLWLCSLTSFLIETTVANIVAATETHSTIWDWKFSAKKRQAHVTYVMWFFLSEYVVGDLLDVHSEVVLRGLCLVADWFLFVLDVAVVCKEFLLRFDENLANVLIRFFENKGLEWTACDLSFGHKF